MHKIVNLLKGLSGGSNKLVLVPPWVVISLVSGSSLQNEVYLLESRAKKSWLDRLKIDPLIE